MQIKGKKILKVVWRILRICLIALLVMGIAAYLVYAMASMTEGDPEEVCNELTVNIDDARKARFIDAATIERSLRSRQLYPQGQKMRDVSCRSIEEYLRQNQFIESVECYKSSHGRVCLDIVQRTPSAYVLPSGGNGYFVDRKGRVIPNTIYATNLVTATGDISPQFATTELVHFCNFIQDNAFWDNQIEQIHVTLDKNGKPTVELVPRVGNHIVSMGSIDGYEKKLRRLRTFYEKAIGTVGWNKYSRISIQYDNQIICTQRDNKKKK